MDREAYIEDTTDAARDLLDWLRLAGKPGEDLDMAIDAVIDAVWEEEEGTERVDAALDAMVAAYNASRPAGRAPMPGREAITA